MLMRLRTSHFRFIYTFDSGHQLIGIVEGDYFPNAPDVVFNLRSLKAICLDSQNNSVMNFDTVFGQFTFDEAETLFSGSKQDQGSFFSFNYRDAEASVYDAATDTWIASGWNPSNWRVEELSIPKVRARYAKVAIPVWSAPAIA